MSKEREGWEICLDIRSVIEGIASRFGRPPVGRAENFQQAPRGYTDQSRIREPGPEWHGGLSGRSQGNNARGQELQAGTAPLRLKKERAKSNVRPILTHRFAASACKSILSLGPTPIP